MKQVTQRLRNGSVEVLDVPEPVLTPETLLVDVRASLLSPGTERAKVEAGRKGLIGKARSRPDQVAQVVEKALNDGVLQTVRAVRAQLNRPSVLGYSAAGVVLAAGIRARGVAVGDRVAVGGGDYAVHAEIDRVPANLCVPLPEGVSFEEGCFACIGSIALHAVRQAEVSLSERVAVIGLGLVGQLTGLLLRAAGCTVVGIDLNAALVERAPEIGAVDVSFHRSALSDTLPHAAGSCDAVIVTAATSSNDPVELAPRLCRDRGRVVIVGDVGMRVPRATYYDKEIDLRLARSYGPGRYDRAYEEYGQDYPIGYVRWTEGRNMNAVVELIAAGRLPVANLITARLPIGGAGAAYERLATGAVSPLGVVIQYPESSLSSGATAVSDGQPSDGAYATPKGSRDQASIIGTGSFAQRILIPSLRAAGFSMNTVASATGVSARAVVEHIGTGTVGRPEDAVLSDAGLLVVATRHASHAELAERALRAGKAVFVEKPPCLTWEELQRLRDARAASGCELAVGFNRRHAPLAIRLREHVGVGDHPRHVLIRVNAGRLPDDHWVNDPQEGGGRLLGEGCHFVDLACWLVGGAPTTVQATVQPLDGETIQTAQRFTLSFGFADGSLATILYTDQGATALAKEYVEVHAGGRSGVLHDFRHLELLDGRSRNQVRGRRQDKGHRTQFVHLRTRLAEGAASAQLDPLDSMHITLVALDSASLGQPTHLEYLAGLSSANSRVTSSPGSVKVLP
jgi:predicted dehydrogenase/threonine dehydrogenase-like Zn-dependent dehydrogenase